MELSRIILLSTKKSKWHFICVLWKIRCLVKSTERTFLYLSELQKKLFAVLIWTETILDQNWIIYLFSYLNICINQWWQNMSPKWSLNFLNRISASCVKFHLQQNKRLSHTLQSFNEVNTGVGLLTTFKPIKRRQTVNSDFSLDKKI